MGNTFDRVYKQASCINVAFHGREGGEKGMMMMEGERFELEYFGRRGIREF